MSHEQMEKRVETSAAVIKMIIEKIRSFLGNNNTKYDSATSMHTPETKT